MHQLPTKWNGKWNYNPPWSPHFGEAHHTMVKAAKRANYSILGNAEVTDEELVTAFTGDESLIKSRTWTYQSASIEDAAPLTPIFYLDKLEEYLAQNQ